MPIRYPNPLNEDEIYIGWPRSSHRLGYDRRALLWQTIVAAVVLPFSYFFGNPHDNVNWVHGFGEQRQTILPAPLFVLFLMLMFPLVVYFPMHLLLARLFGPGHS